MSKIQHYVCHSLKSTFNYKYLSFYCLHHESDAIDLLMTDVIGDTG